jgi:hypothetical protein
MSNVASTSILAYEKYADSLPEKRAAIFRHFLKHPDENFTNRELAVALGTIPSNISPKVLTLRKDGWLVHIDTRACRITGNYAKAWSVNWRQTEGHTDGVEYIEHGVFAVQAQPWISRDKWIYLDTVLKGRGFKYQGKGVWKR